MNVIKLGGRAQSDSQLPAAIRGAWERAKGNLCVVHGGGDEISALQVALGKKPAFVNGRRVTTADDIQLLRMVLSGVINKRLVSAFARAGVPALGLSGEDGRLIAARKPDESDPMFVLGAVGIPAKINAPLIEGVTKLGYMPVISPVGSDADSESGALNVNGDDAAAAIAAAVDATELLFIADVKGVLNGEKLISAIDLADVPELVEKGVIKGGMTAKLDAARTALAGGVDRVRISDIGGVTDGSRGTIVTFSEAGVK